MLGRVARMREQIAKAWLVDVILDRPLAEAERMPMRWARSRPKPTLRTPDVTRRYGAAPGKRRDTNDAGAPMSAVITPTGSSTGAMSVRASTSQPTRNAAPNSADAGRTMR